MDKKEIKINDSKIVYRLSGKGKPVMLVHGFGETGNVWKNQIEFLGNKFNIIVPDLPGTGDSGMTDDMSMEGMAETLKEILDKERIDTCTMIGHSMGGYIMLAFAEKYLSRLNAFGLFHSSAFADSEEKKATRRKGIEFINKHGAFEFLKNTTPNLFSPFTKDSNPELVDKHIQSLTGFSPSALVAYYEGMIRRPDRTSVLRDSSVPVLFTSGVYDSAVPLTDCLKQCHLPEFSFVNILENSGHLGMLEEPGKSNIILEDFLHEVNIPVKA